MSDHIERFAAEYASKLQCKDRSDDVAQEAFVRGDEFLAVRAPEMWLVLINETHLGVSVFNSKSQGGKRNLIWALDPPRKRFTVHADLLPQAKLTVAFEPRGYVINYSLTTQPSDQDPPETISSGRLRIQKLPSSYDACFVHKARRMTLVEATEFLLTLVFNAVEGLPL